MQFTFKFIRQFLPHVNSSCVHIVFFCACALKRVRHWHAGPCQMGCRISSIYHLGVTSCFLHTWASYPSNRIAWWPNCQWAGPVLTADEMAVLTSQSLRQSRLIMESHIEASARQRRAQTAVPLLRCRAPLHQPYLLARNPQRRLLTSDNAASSGSFGSVSSSCRSDCTLVAF